MIEISAEQQLYLLGTDVLHDVLALIEHVSRVGGLNVQLLSRLRLTHPSTWQIVAELAVGTHRAQRLGKQPNPSWLFTQATAEQATHPTIAKHHAQRYVGANHVVEICTGAALDTLALAHVARKVTTIESDALTAAIAQGNLLRSGRTNVTVVHGSFPECMPQPLSDVGGVWADPARRFEGKRFRSNEELMPQLAQIQRFAENVQVCGIKLGPATEHDKSEHYTQEFIGFENECKEQILWKYNHQEPKSLVVNILDSHELWSPRSTQLPQTLPITPGCIIVEPHNALIASGCVGQWFADSGLGVVNPHIAYGIAQQPLPASRMYAQFEVIVVDENIQKRKIQERITALGWSKYTEIKKRGVSLNPTELHGWLTFAEGNVYGVVLLMRLDTTHAAVYAQRIQRQET